MIRPQVRSGGSPDGPDQAEDVERGEQEVEYRVEERSKGQGSAEGRPRPLGADLEAAQWQARRGSSMLTQFRTEKIGLPAYLFNTARSQGSTIPSANAAVDRRRWLDWDTRRGRRI